MGDAANAEAGPLRVRRAVITLGLTQTIGYASTFYLPAPLAAEMGPAVGASGAFVFLARSGASLVPALAAPWAGRLVDRRGGRAPLAAASVLMALGVAGMGVSQTPGQLGLAWMVAGLGMLLGLYDVAFAALVGWYGQDARRAITGVTLIAGFASTVGWPLTAALEAGVGWRGACLFWAGANLFVALPLHLSLPKGVGLARPAAPAPADPPAADHRPFAPLVMVTLAFAVIGGISSAVSTNLPAMLRAVGVGAAAALAAGALLGPAQVAGRLAEFTFARRVHPLVSARFAIGLFPLACVVLLLAGPPGAAAFAIVYGAGNGLYTIVRGTLPLALFGAEGYGRRAGLINLPGRLLGAVSPFLLALGLSASPRLAVAALGALGLAALAILLVLRRPRQP